MRGFTLIEMMVVIAITAILFTIAIGAYQSLRSDSLVTSARDQISSILHQARLTALSQRVSQAVTIDFTNDAITDALGNSHSYDGVDIEKVPSGSCTPDATASQAITFTSLGAATASVIKLSSASSTVTSYLIVNAITGGVYMYGSCTGSGVLS